MQLAPRSALFPLLFHSFWELCCTLVSSGSGPSHPILISPLVPSLELLHLLLLNTILMWTISKPSCTRSTCIPPISHRGSNLVCNHWVG